jgi:lysophospholipase L1-like esterase
MKRARIHPLPALLSLLLALAPLSIHPAAAAGAPRFNPPKQFYLALGDSLAFGYQQWKDEAGLPPSAFNTGYVDDFAQMLAGVRPDIQTVNYACSGETTTSFMQGGCQHPDKRHSLYPGSQLAAALTFLDAHRGQVSPITIDLGADDVLSLVGICGGLTNVACLAAGEQLAIANLAQILRDLRQAAPSSEIIVLQYYNPFAVLNATTDFLNALTIEANSGIAAAAGGQRDRVADAFTPFNLTSPEPQTLCALTFVCTPLQDIHPSDAGYGVIAQQFWEASGYDRLGS